MTHSIAKLVHSIAGAADAADAGRNMIYDAINNGQLKAKKMGRRTIILDEDLREWLATLPDFESGKDAAEMARRRRRSPRSERLQP
jgi:hypothetical protein